MGVKIESKGVGGYQERSKIILIALTSQPKALAASGSPPIESGSAMHYGKRIDILEGSA